MSVTPIPADDSVAGPASTGQVVAAAVGERLADRYPRAGGLLDELATAGHILLRGFGPSAADFNALVDAASSRITIDPARVFVGDNAQRVDSGSGPIGLHIENGATPFAPDLVWFFCEQAAASGSETTVCDGARVWRGLSDGARRHFASAPLVFSRTVPETLWKRFVAHAAGRRDPEAVGFADVAAVMPKDKDVEYELNSDGSLHYRFSTFAAAPSRWSTEIAWANSIFGPSYNYEEPEIVFADGRPLAEDALAEAAAVCAEVTEDIAWRDGDIVVVDNSRVMHGRRAITDPRRSIFNAQSFV